MQSHINVFSLLMMCLIFVEMYGDLAVTIHNYGPLLYPSAIILLSQIASLNASAAAVYLAFVVDCG